MYLLFFFFLEQQWNWPTKKISFFWAVCLVYWGHDPRMLIQVTSPVENMKILYFLVSTHWEVVGCLLTSPKWMLQYLLDLLSCPPHPSLAVSIPRTGNALIAIWCDWRKEEQKTKEEQKMESKYYSLSKHGLHDLFPSIKLVHWLINY